jgi:small nuclear ribonucleoprotein (snRNP)-like protein
MADPADEAERRRQLQLGLFAGLVGKKVSLSTTDQHHLVGRLLEVDPHDRLKLLVENHEVYVNRRGVARIHEADPALAEYIK